jgi:hypothetical protein
MQNRKSQRAVAPVTLMLAIFTVVILVMVGFARYENSIDFQSVKPLVPDTSEVDAWGKPVSR